MNILKCKKYVACLPPPDAVSVDCPSLCPLKEGCRICFWIQIPLSPVNRVIMR